MHGAGWLGLTVFVSFATGHPDLIELGLAATAYRYDIAAVHAFNNAPSFSNHV